MPTEEEAFVQTAIQMMTATPGQRIILVIERPDGSNQFFANNNSLAWLIGILKIMQRTIKRDMKEKRNKTAEEMALAQQDRMYEEAKNPKKKDVQ